MRSIITAILTVSALAFVAPATAQIVPADDAQASESAVEVSIEEFVQAKMAFRESVTVDTATVAVAEARRQCHALLENQAANPEATMRDQMTMQANLAKVMLLTEFGVYGVHDAMSVVQQMLEETYTFSSCRRLLNRVK